MPLPESLPEKILSHCSLTQAVLWLAHDIKPMPPAYQEAHEYKITNSLDEIPFKQGTPQRAKYKRDIDIACNLILIKLQEGEITAWGERAAPNSIQRKNLHPSLPNRYHIRKYPGNTTDVVEIPLEAWILGSVQWHDNQLLFTNYPRVMSFGWDSEIWADETMLGFGDIKMLSRDLMKRFTGVDINQRKDNQGFFASPYRTEWMMLMDNAISHFTPEGINDEKKETITSWLMKSSGDLKISKRNAEVMATFLRNKDKMKGGLTKLQLEKK